MFVFFNRWGGEIQTFDGLTTGWDGKMKTGKLVDDGTYYYVIKALGYDGKNYEEKGFVQVITK